MGAKLSRRDRIKKGIRKRLSGSTERPRLSVFRSNKGIYAQIIDDLTGKTIVSASSLSKDFVAAEGTKSDQSVAVGKLVAQKLSQQVLKMWFSTGTVICTMVVLSHWPKVHVKVV
jgi:large subunit ribosomal protein L18